MQQGLTLSQVALLDLALMVNPNPKTLTFNSNLYGISPSATSSPVTQNNREEHTRWILS